MRRATQTRSGSVRAAVGAALILASTFPPRPATAQGDLSESDLANLLYSNQFTFDPDGIPMVNIGLMDGRDEVRFVADAGFVFTSTTETGTRIHTPKGRLWRAWVKDGRPAEIRYWAVVSRLASPEPSRVAEELARWRGLGYREATSFELGAVFGFQGQVFDNRSVVIGVGGAPDREQALEVARRLYQERQIPIAIHEELVEPPRGWIVCEDQRHEIRIESPRVLMAVPADHGLFRVLKVEYGKGTRWHRFQDRRYRGALYLAVDRHGKLAVGNQVNSEQLLAGLVPAEIYPDAPEAALEAQAVAARGILLSKLGTRHLADPYLLCAHVHCQVYSGVDRETEATTRATMATRGELLFDARGNLVDTVYHASSGGHTANNETVWPATPDPNLRGRPDTKTDSGPRPGPDDASTRAFLMDPLVDAYAGVTRRGRELLRWKVVMPASKVDRLVAKRYPRVGRVLDLVATRRGPSGRIMELLVHGEGRDVTVHRELPVRRLLGGLKSGLFVVDVQRRKDGRPKRFVFHGGGFGHGVGMCQMGAIGRAVEGQDYRTILAHYYNGAKVRRIY